MGLPLSRELIGKGHRVIGFDIDSKKVDMLNQGESYIRHISSDLIKQWLDSESFQATDDYKNLKDVGAILICVPTPLDEHREPDLTYVVETTRAIAANLQKDQLVVLESTTYPGTTDEVILPILEERGMIAGEDFFLAYSPEREDPGNEKYTTSKIPKVIGGYTKACLDRALDLYKSIVEVVPVSSTRVAEASKILENTYRAVNIAMVNELKMLFDRMDIDIWQVIEAAATKPFGFQPFFPGPGLGGHCIPIDPFYLTWKAKEYDFSTRFIELAGEINANQPYYVVEKIIRALNSQNRSIVDANILIAGVAYKPDVDDMRESPALKIIDLLMREGADVSYYDPLIPNIPMTRKYQFDMETINLEKIKENHYDATIIITNHKVMDYTAILKTTKLVVDTRNAMRDANIKSNKIRKA